MKDNSQKKKAIYAVLLPFAAAAIVLFPLALLWGEAGGEWLTEIFIPVYAAIVGGGITLVGVLLTIKHNKEERLAKEYQRHKPFIVRDNSVYLLDYDKMIPIVIIDLYNDEMKIGEDNVYFIDKPVFTNVGESTISINYIKFNDRKSKLWVEQIIPAHKTFYIYPNNWCRSVCVDGGALKTIKLGIRDIYSNQYEYNVVFSLVKMTTRPDNDRYFEKVDKRRIKTQEDGSVTFNLIEFKAVECFSDIITCDSKDN